MHVKKDGSLYRYGIRGPASGIAGALGADGQMIPFVKIDAQDDVLLGQMADGSLRHFWQLGSNDLLLPPGSSIQDFSAWNRYYCTSLVLEGNRVRALDGPVGQGVFSPEDQARLAAWQDVVQVAAGAKGPDDFVNHQSIGGRPMVAAIKQDGSVIALDPEMNREVSTWAGIQKIVLGDGFLLGLTLDGRVLAAGPRKQQVAEEVKAWTDITDIAAGGYFCAGLTAEGRLVFAGEAQFDHN